MILRSRAGLVILSLLLSAGAAFGQSPVTAFPFRDQESFAMYPQSAGEIEFFNSDGSVTNFSVAVDNLATRGRREYFKGNLTSDGGLTFLQLSSANFGTWNWLVLYKLDTSAIGGDGLLIGYPEGKAKPYLFLWKLDRWMTDSVYRASSRLTEGSTVYDEGNLGRLDLHNPWVPHGKKNGIGESVTIASGENRGPFNQLAISNGFVSAEKPYLFRQNNRVRQLRISGSNAEFEMVVPLDDSPNIQTIALPKSVTGVRVEIVDVFPGTKYTDTCVNFIVPLSE